MKMTARSEYALLALVYLARQADTGIYVSVDTIATAQDIPFKFLEMLMLAMKRARFVTSCKGRNGGYRLLKPASDITLADIIRLFDGALAPTESASTYFYEKTPIEKEARLLKVFKNIRDHISQTLENTTVADVV
jgi:Rrf2 family protein